MEIRCHNAYRGVIPARDPSDCPICHGQGWCVVTDKQCIMGYHATCINNRCDCPCHDWPQDSRKEDK